MKHVALMLGLLVLLGVSAATMAQRFSAHVVAVIDGDTLVVAHDDRGNRKSTVRLADIDAPEKSQPYGSASRVALLMLVLHKQVQVTPRVIDDYGRVVATVHVDNIDVSDAQVRRGMAWEYSRYHAKQSLKMLEDEARRARLGLWLQSNPVPPWEFRKSQGHASKAPAATLACGKKHYCSQMASCEEAKFYLMQCHVKTLDKDGDGVPCENLCNSKLR